MYIRSNFNSLFLSLFGWKLVPSNFSPRIFIKLGYKISKPNIVIMCSRSAVCIQNVYKSYENNHPVLNNFCMNIKQGTIYSLLGSSGCGKTTILSCIVGLETWEFGEILVFGKKPGSKGSEIPGRKLGYMPQELALYKHLTIREIIQVYGQIYNMTNTQIEERYEFLRNLLDLPEDFGHIGDLSGGQKRRASLALALIHNPKLLVLDEPTAGVDPLLRKNIWDHLLNLVKNGDTTVLITTHYIEETRLSNTIGVMRNGCLLVQDSPANILKSYKCEILEEAVLHLCREDETKRKIVSINTPPTQGYNHEVVFNASWTRKVNSMNGVSTGDNVDVSPKILSLQKSMEFDSDLSDKDKCSAWDTKCEKVLGSRGVYQAYQRIYGFTTILLLTYIRNPVYLGMILFLPVIQSILSLLCLSAKPNSLYFGIVNHEFSNWTNECNLTKYSGKFCVLSALSCQYIQQIDKGDTLILESFDMEEDALAQVHLGNIFGYMIFQENFSQDTINLGTFKQFASNEALQGSRIHTYLDYSRYVQIFIIVSHLQDSFFTFVRKLGKSCGFNGHLDRFNFRPPIYGSMDKDFTDYITPGLTLISLFGLGMGLAGVNLASDRKQGTLTRAQAAGLLDGDVIFSHLISQVIVIMSQLIIWNAILHYGFGFVILGSPWIWHTVCVLVEISGACCGLLIGQIFQNELKVELFAIFLFTFFVFMGCVFFPVEWMPKFLQYAAYIVPIYLPSNSLRSVVVRGFGATHPLVWPGIVSIIVWILVLIVCLIVWLKLSGK